MLYDLIIEKFNYFYEVLHRFLIFYYENQEHH
jgi:hypothetical protein